MTGDALVVLAPAKVNLYLAVGRRQPDGYHPLVTVFERLDLADTVQLTPQPAGIVLTSDDPAMPTDGRNLIVRAARAFFEAAEIAGGAAIHLTKRIPVAAGLGGGSSDAAATLRGLNAVYGAPLTGPRLFQLARLLGADVPFFVADVAVAQGTGRGDEVTPYAPPPAPLWHLLVNPGVPLLTKAVYEAFDRLPATTLTPSVTDATLLADSIRAGDVAEIAARLANALEPAIEACYPAIRLVKAALTDGGARGVLISGSGPTVFGLAESEAHAGDLQARVQRAHPAWRVVIARTALAMPDLWS